MSEILQAILLGLIEGFTEFLPISSTGHIILAEEVLRYKDASETFAVVIQVGAIGAVIWHYRRELKLKISQLFGLKQASIRFWLNILLATLPTAAGGWLVVDSFEEYSTPPVIAVALILGGIVIWLIEHFHKIKKSGEQAKFEQITHKQALAVGLYQVFALVPGVSRAAATIMGGVVSGFDRVTATAFSFYLGIPIILLAGGYKLISGSSEINEISGGWPALVIGTFVSFVVALATIKWLLRYIARKDFKIFAYYRIILGVIILLIL